MLSSAPVIKYFLFLFGDFINLMPAVKPPPLLMAPPLARDTTARGPNCLRKKEKREEGKGPPDVGPVGPADCHSLKRCNTLIFLGIR